MNTYLFDTLWPNYCLRRHKFIFPTSISFLTTLDIIISLKLECLFLFICISMNIGEVEHFLYVYYPYYVINYSFMSLANFLHWHVNIFMINKIYIK